MKKLSIKDNRNAYSFGFHINSTSPIINRWINEKELTKRRSRVFHKWINSNWNTIGGIHPPPSSLFRKKTVEYLCFRTDVLFINAIEFHLYKYQATLHAIPLADDTLHFLFFRGQAVLKFDITIQYFVCTTRILLLTYRDSVLPNCSEDKRFIRPEFVY